MWAHVACRGCSTGIMLLEGSKRGAWRKWTSSGDLHGTLIMEGSEARLRPWLLLKWDGCKRKWNCAQILDIFWTWSQQDLLTDLILEKTKELGIIPRHVAWGSGKGELAISWGEETQEGAGSGRKDRSLVFKMFSLWCLFDTQVE